MKPAVALTLCAAFTSASAVLLLLPSTSPIAPPLSSATPQGATPDASSSQRSSEPLTILAAKGSPETAPKPVNVAQTADTALPVPPAPDFRPIGESAAPAPAPTKLKYRRPLPRRELERRAQVVEAEANEELERLLPLLDLTPTQQDRVFAIFAVTSPLYDPAMNVGGTPSVNQRIRDAIESGADIDETRLLEIYDAVEDEQSATPQDEGAAEDEWWGNIIADLESELSDTPGFDTDPSADPSAVLLASPGDTDNPSDDEISVTRPTVFPSEDE